MNTFFKKSGVLWAIVLIAFTSCEKNTSYQDHLKDPQLFSEAMQTLTDVIVHDIFSPPVASRIYVYPTVAAYSIMQQAYPDQYADLAGQLNDLTSIPKPKSKEVDMNLAAIHAFLKLSQNFIFSEEKIEAYRDGLYEQLDEEGLPSGVKKASLAYGDEVAAHIMAWANTDFYKQTRTFPKYTIQEGDAYWKPTPPMYMEGIEPSWNKIRTLVLDYPDQFMPKAPLPIDLSTDSPFYAQLKEVYDVGNEMSLDPEGEKAQIAAFWDCNPFVSHQRGHAMFATKKISPGGHWINIVKIASEQAGSDFPQTINAYTRVTISLFDAFISCWDTKWKTIVVRPETLINQYIDEQWMPHLQTPPFPEYTSGHSVISRASAIALTGIYGDNFSFVDSSERRYGLPDRSFTSFLQASEEAALSRMYGGIHYRMAIEEGITQGEAVGRYIQEKLVTALPKTN